MRVSGEGSARDEPVSDWELRRRLAEIFGDVLPDTTSDERDPEDASGGRARRGESAGDSWLRDQVPPHHGT